MTLFSGMYIKNAVYGAVGHVARGETLKRRITGVTEIITPEMR
jgi:hypothetical protein